MKILMISMTLTLVNLVSADLIGWNRTRNNEHQRKFRAEDVSSQFLDQIQRFYSKQGKNNQFLKARRALEYGVNQASADGLGGQVVFGRVQKFRPKLRKFHRKL